MKVEQFTFVWPSDSIQTRFERFHNRNPKVYDGLVRLAYQAKRKREHVGMKMLYEVLRWEWIISGLPDSHEQFKLNNDYTSRYARLIMDDHPDLEGLFKLRELR